MIVNVRPVERLCGRIHLPASKSYSIRAFIIAACGGESRIEQPSNCEDACIAIKIARALGASITHKGDIWHVKARSHMLASRTFSVGESGTTLRFLLPLLALHTQKARVEGQGSLVGRPNAHLCETLRRQGMDIRGKGLRESVPMVFKGGQLQGGTLSVDGSLSSQFISALLIALPGSLKSSCLMITGKQMVSRDYILMTRAILAQAGIVINELSPRKFEVKGAQQFKGLKDFHVPSDYGLAAFAMGAAALLPSNVVLQGNLDEDLIQSDGHIFEFLRRMGVDFKKTQKAIEMKGPFDLKGGTFSLKDCPDLVPIMSVLALFARGKTKLVGIHHARIKESDRISDLRNELLKVGAQVSETADALTISPRASYKDGQLLDAHHDHRLAMAFTVLGAKIGCRVKGMESTHKSYPDFVKDMKALGAI